MSEALVALAALATCLGAMTGIAAPDWLAAVPAVVILAPVAMAWLTQRPRLVVGALFLLGAWRGAVEVDGWERAIVSSGRLDAVVEVVEDPEPIALGVAGVRTVVRLPDGRRLRAEAYGGAAGELARSSVGSTISVQGTLRAVAPDGWNRTRHLVGRASLEEITPVRGPQGAWAVAEWLRSSVERGAAALDDDRRALYLGLVTGDDRGQSVSQRARFRLAGLSHLLAVSGQNVAFVLAIVGPGLRRLPIRARLPVVCAALVVFALVTRLEPSVVRATVTAAVATWAATQGRRTEGVRVLSVAVLALVLVDPFLVGSIGFQLSVAASAGIVVLSPSLLARLPGPWWLAEPLAVTLAAQTAVAPIITVVFGPIGLVSIPANLAAGTVAGLVMMWGVSVGLALGVLGVGPAVLGVVGLPVELALWWIDRVARVSATLPLPRLELGVAALGAAWWWTTRLGAQARRRGRAAVVAVAMVLQPGFVPSPSSPAGGGAVELRGGGSWFDTGEGGLLVVGVGADQRLISSLLERRVQASVVVTEGGARRHRDLLVEIVDVLDPSLVLAPPGHRVRGAYVVSDARRLVVEGGVVVLEPGADTLEVGFVARPQD